MRKHARWERYWNHTVAKKIYERNQFDTHEQRCNRRAFFFISTIFLAYLHKDIRFLHCYCTRTHTRRPKFTLTHTHIATSMNTYGWFLCFGITCFFLSFFMMKKWIYTNSRSETKTKWFRRKNHICRYALNEGSSSNRTESSWADVLWHLVPWRLFMCVYRFGQVKRVYSSQSTNL